MKYGRIAVLVGIGSFAGAVGLGAQTLEEVCPGAEAGTGVLWGGVNDVDAEMALPGATVQVTWEKDGTPGRSEAQTAIDGSYTICYLPLETDLTVQSLVGGMPGETVMLALSEKITRQDLRFSLTGNLSSADDSSADRMWACIGPPNSEFRLEVAQVVRCDDQWPDLDRCPKQELGRVSAAASGQRGAAREVVERLVQEAERLEANAIVRIEPGQGSLSGQAVRIDVDPMTC